jgi:hypothetical protein
MPIYPDLFYVTELGDKCAPITCLEYSQHISSTTMIYIIGGDIKEVNFQYLKYPADVLHIVHVLVHVHVSQTRLHQIISDRC